MARASGKSAVVIAIDGPSAAGKGTLAHRLAEHLGFAVLDTGLLYRAVAKRLLDRGETPENEAAARQVAAAVSIAELGNPRLRGESMAEAASRVSAIPAVRTALLALQRRFAENPLDSQGNPLPGAVLDGRDIGTVICPDATVKLFITASVEARAARRHKELLDRGVASIYARVLQDMERRDARDSGRAVAPTKPAPDAFVIDTTTLDADGAFAAALAVIRERLGRA
jgi:cytidylate kinase